MIKKKAHKKSKNVNSKVYDLVFEMENSINAIAWGCDALVHTLHDSEANQIDGAVWVAKKIKEEALSLQEQYKILFQVSRYPRQYSD
jgi:hypothetical protein